MARIIITIEDMPDGEGFVTTWDGITDDPQTLAQEFAYNLKLNATELKKLMGIMEESKPDKNGYH